MSCGQFDFHDKQRAIADLQKIDVENLEIQESTRSAKHRTAYVCDLRFLKPKRVWKDDMVMFSPDFSYRISELIETHLPNKIQDTITLVGTFGCMTGMYLCVSSEHWDQSDVPIIHAAIIDILQEHIDADSLNPGEKLQLITLLENYTNNLK
jgi:S-ribosylhomocysteine lyase LuxS involved in autoinducer biosynthesis